MRYLIPLLVIAGGVLAAAGAEPVERDEFSMTLEENIVYPPCSAKKADRLEGAMKELQRRLQNKKFKTVMERDEQVVCVLIPASELFRANSRELSPEGRTRLTGLAQFVEHDSQFKVLVAVHSDSTGDERYNDDLTSARANAIDDFFEATAGRELNIIPYGLGHDEPVGSDATKKGRAANRRVEIFFVPTAAYMRSLGAL
ncbi:MAG: OmpA family protein [Muribaculaceae bacterium]|nr:OmpA family protein [Muribaculaceae bacterium]